MLAIDPTTPTTLYVGTATGVFKSTDGGGSWNPIGPGLVSPGISLTPVYALAIDPTTPATVYAGGAYKSTDGGGTWRPTALATSVLALAIDPTTPTTLYADGFKSTDGGSSWSALDLATAAVDALAIDPTTPTTLYAGTYYAPGTYAATFLGVHKSVDGGASWSPLNAGFPPKTVVTALALDSAKPTTLYAGTGAGVFAIQQVPASCVGDCNVDGKVTVDELVKGVNIALGTATLAQCQAFDCHGNGHVTVDCLMQAVNSALHGCGG